MLNNPTRLTVCPLSQDPEFLPPSGKCLRNLSVMSGSSKPNVCSPPGSSTHGDSSGKNTGVGYHVLLQGIFPTQGLNPGLPHCRWILYHLSHQFSSFQFSSVAQLCPTLCNPMNRSTPGLLVHHQLPEFTQTHVHRVGDAIQPSHPLSSPSPPAFKLPQCQGLFQMSQLFASGGQSIGVSASTSVLQMNIQD